MLQRLAKGFYGTRTGTGFAVIALIRIRRLRSRCAGRSQRKWHPAATMAMKAMSSTILTE